MANGNLYTMTMDTSKVNPRYVMLYLNSESGHKQLRAKCSTGALPNIAKSDLESVKIPMIPFEEQNNLVKKYMELLRELHIVENKASKLRENTNSVLV